MARRRLIIHGSQEEMDMFEPIYNTRLRLQHGTSTSRFYLPDPPLSAESEQEVEDEGGVTIVQTADHHEGNGAAVETACWRSSGNDENDSLPDEASPHSTALTEELVGFADNGSTGMQGNESEIPASASHETPDSATDTNTDSESDFCERE